MAFDSTKNKNTVAVANADTTVSVGTPGAAMTDAGGAFSQATLNNNFATLATEINEIKAALRAAGILAS